MSVYSYLPITIHQPCNSNMWREIILLFFVLRTLNGDKLQELEITVIISLYDNCKLIC